VIKEDWSDSRYYNEVEDKAAIERFWHESSLFRPLFDKLILNDILELACGHGRHSEFILRNLSFNTITLMDINESNILFCKQRFSGNDRFRFVVNSGSGFDDLDNESVDSIFCYDAMVHFEYDDVFSYIKDAFRILRPGGRALFHHSNNSRYPGNLYSQNPHWRNFMSANFFSHVAMRSGLIVLAQNVIDWSADEDSKHLDCVTLLEKLSNNADASSA
jgi:ubiquinone/menaquinone biosynthesis C-methylase UbiE